MGYQGRYLQPNHAYNNSDVRVLDTFDSTFNGSLTTFNLTENGAVYRTLNAESLFVKLDGVIQTPRVDYTISSSAGQSQITFTTAPNTGLDCEIRVILGAKGRPQILTDDIDLALASNPPSPSEGHLYYNTTEDELRVYNGTEWDTLRTVKMFKEQVDINSTDLSGDGEIYLDQGMVHYRTGNLVQNAIPNVKYNINTNLNDVMNVGETLTFTIIQTTNSTSAYVTGLQIDSTNVTNSINWVGGSAPSAGGSSGVDIYTFDIIKTAANTYVVIGTQTKTS